MKLLISVRNAREAIDGLAGGADWIDLKEPFQGSLGAVKKSVAESVTQEIEDGYPISAALGELATWDPAIELLSIPRIEVVKLGLAGCDRFADWRSRWAGAFTHCSDRGKHLAAVIYADWKAASAPQPDQIVACASRAGAQYLLIDTFDKRGLSSMAVLGTSAVEHLLQVARKRGMTTVLAGSLRVGDLSAVARLPVDIVAIRGAACTRGRHSTLDRAKVRRFRARLGTACDEM